MRRKKGAFTKSACDRFVTVNYIYNHISKYIYIHESNRTHCIYKIYKDVFEYETNICISYQNSACFYKVNFSYSKRHIFMRHMRHIKHINVFDIRIFLALTKSACAPLVKVMRRGLGRARVANSDIAWKTYLTGPPPKSTEKLI